MCPAVWVSTAYHVPGLGASSPPAPCPLGHWWERSAACPPCRLGEGCGLPQGAHCGLETPLLLGSALRAETFSPRFLPKASRGETAVGNGTVQPAVSPLLPTVLSKWVCHPDQEALGGRGVSWAGPECRSSSFLPPHPQNRRVSQGVEGSPCLPSYVSFCK